MVSSTSGGQRLSAGDRRGLVLGGGTVLVVLVAGLVLGESMIPILGVTIGVLAASVFARPAIAGLVGLVSLVAAALLSWHYGVEASQIVAREVVLLFAGALAVFLAWERERRDRTEELLREHNELVEYLLHDRDGVARALQQALLPPALPEPKGLELAAAYLPAGAGADLGGDFYDVFESVEDCWHVVLGDVCGKGVFAASQIGLAKHTIRAASVEHTDPSTALELVNSVLQQEEDADRFLTAAHLIIDLSGGQASCTIALAGHPPPYLVREGEVRELGDYGPLLGIHEEVAVPSTKAELEEGDLVVAYTDGLIEDRQGRFHPDELEAFLATVGTAPPAEVVTGLERRLAEWRPGPPEDDIAIVAVRVTT